MHSNVVELQRLLPPPAHPRYNRGDWRLVAAELGTDLPQDFKDFTEVYGAVLISNELGLVAPFYFVGDEAYVPLLGKRVSYREMTLRCLREMDAVTGGRDKVPFPDYPTPGGLLPAGGTQNGDLIAWITDGPPDEWGTFFWSFPGLDTFSFPKMSVTAFLIDLLNGSSPLFPSAVAPQYFTPEERFVTVAGTRE